MNTATAEAYELLQSEVNNCKSLQDVKILVRNVLDIDSKHPVFDRIVKALYKKLPNIKLDLVVKYLESMLKDGMGIRAYSEDADIYGLAEDCINKYNVMQRLTMSQFKNIAYTYGYVVGPKIKSTKMLTKLMK